MTVNNKIAKPKRMLSNPDRARLGELLRKRLIECGWKDQLRMLYQQVVRECEGENITFEMIVSKMTPRAHALVPDIVKKEFINEIMICHGPRVLKQGPVTQIRNNEPTIEVPQIERIVPEMAQIVPRGSQHGPQVQVPQVARYVPEIARQVSQRAREVPRMDQ